MIELFSLGAVDLRRDGNAVRSVLTQPKRLALLAYLAAAWPQRFHSRDTLLGLFWPESDSERARNSLRQALHFLRRSLGDGAVVSHGDWVGVEPAALRCDASSFGLAIAEDRLEDALQLYRGDFLPGVYIDDAPDAERWLEEERVRLRATAVAAATTLADRAEERGDLATAVVWARRASALAPVEEGPFRRLALLLHRTGETALALEAAAELTRRLQTEYGLEPSTETQDMIERIRSGKAAGQGRRGQGGKAGESANRGEAGEGAGGREGVGTAGGEAGGRTAGGGAAAAYAAVFGATGGGGAGDDQPAHAAGASCDCAGCRAARGAAGQAGGQTGSVRALQPRRARRRRALTATLAALLVVVAAVAWLVWPRAGGEVAGAAAASAPVPTIAVLPFVNMSGDPEKDYFSDGISEELLNVLAQLPGLRVASRTSSFAFKGKDVGIDSIRSALRVAHVLEGSIRQDRGRVRITAQLIDTESGFHVWSRTYDRELTDIFAVQDEISRAIVEQLQVELTGRYATGPLRRTETESPEAHELVLRSNAVFAHHTRESYDQAAEFARQAIRTDSSYARAYATLAVVRMWQANMRYIALDEGYDEARALAERSRRLDPQLGDPLVVLGWIAMTREWDWDGAEELFRQAELRTPNDRRIPNYRAILLTRLGRMEEAIAAGKRVVEVDPTWTGAYNNLGAIYGIAGKPDSAVLANRRALELAPDRAATWVMLSMSFSLGMQHDSAIAWGERAYESAPDDQYTIATLAHAYARAGRTDDARSLLHRLEAQEHPSIYLRAMIHATLREPERMFALLEQAYAERDDAMADLAEDPSFAEYREDARMRDLVRRIRTGR